MAAGVIQEALERAGYLAPGLNSLSKGLNEYMGKKNKLAGLQRLAELTDKAKGNINNAFNPYQSATPINNAPITDNSPSRAFDLLPTPFGPPIDMRGAKDPIANAALMSAPGTLKDLVPQQLNTYDRRPIQPEGYNQAAGAANSAIFDFLSTAGTDPNIDPSAANNFARALQSLIPQKPETPKLTELGPGNILVDSKGKQIAANPKPAPEKKAQVFDIEGAYKNPKTGTVWTYDKTTGQTKDLGVPYDKNEGRSKAEEKVLSLEDLQRDFGEASSIIQHFKQNWNDLESENDPAYRRAKSDLAGISRRAAQRGEDYFPGYKKISGVLWAKKKSGASKEQLLQEISALEIPDQVKGILEIEFNSGVY